MNKCAKTPGSSRLSEWGLVVAIILAIITGGAPTSKGQGDLVGWGFQVVVGQENASNPLAAEDNRGQ